MLSSLVQITFKTFKKDWKRVVVAILVVAFSVSFLASIVVATDSALPTIYKDLTFSGVEDIRLKFNNPFESPTIKNLTQLFENANHDNVLSKFDYYPRLALQFRTTYKGNDIESLLYTISSTEDPLYTNLILDEGSMFHSLSDNECIVSRALAQKYNLRINDVLNISILGISEKNVILIISGIAHLRGAESVYPLSSYYREFILTGHLTVCKISPKLRNKVGYLGIYLKENYLSDYQTYNKTLDTVVNWLTKTISQAHYSVSVERVKIYALRLYFPRIETYKTRFLFITSFVLIGSVVAIITTQLIRYHKALYQIGLLKAIGFKNREIVKLFLYEAFFIGIFGSSLGAGLGFLFNPLIRNFLVETNLSEIMFQDLLYDPLKSANYTIAVVPSDLLLVIVMSFTLIVITSLFPAIRASKVDPAIILRPRSLLDITRRNHLSIKVRKTFLSIFKVVKLWKIILKGHEDLIYALMKRRRDIYATITIFLTSSVIILLFTSSMIHITLQGTYATVYNQYGSDIYASGFVNKSATSELTKLDGVTSVTILETVDLVSVNINNFSYIPTGEENTHLSLKIINSSEVLNTLRWEYISNATYIKSLLSRLQSGKNILMSRKVLNYIGKSVGDVINLKLTDIFNGNSTPTVYYENNFKIVGYFNFSLPGVADEYTVVVPKGIIPDNLTIGCNALIRVNNIGIAESVSRNASSFLYGANIYVPIKIAKERLEQFNAYYSLSFVVTTITVLLVTLSLSTILLTETIEQKYVFSILYALGYKKRILYTIILIEAFTIGLISIVVGILFSGVLAVVLSGIQVASISRLVLGLVEPLFIYENNVLLIITLVCSIVAALPSVLEIHQTNFENVMRMLNE